MPQSRRRRRRGRPVQGRGTGATLRTYRQQPRQSSGRRWLYVTASAVIAVLVIAGFTVPSLVGLGGGNFGGSTGASYEYVDGVGTQHPVMVTRRHVPNGETVEYNSIPATSGDHWAAWSECGFFEEELPDERVVHNLEHGNIVVSYNLATPEEVGELRDVLDDIGLANVHGVARRYTKIPQGDVALAAWGVSDQMTGVDKDRIERFFETYAGTLGPEFPNGSPCTVGGVMPQTSG